MNNSDMAQMSLAYSYADHSKDPSARVGCVITCKDGGFLGGGYNSFITDADHSHFSWDRPAKYQYVIHAEMNAIINSKSSLDGGVAYITDAPCDVCLKHLLQAGVRKVIYDNPRIMRSRGTAEQRDTIARLIKATGATVENVNGNDIITDITADSYH